MNWGWVVSASTLRWWLLKTLPFAWKLLSATKSMPDLYHQALKCLSMVSTHDHQGDLKASLAGGVYIDNNFFLPIDSFVFAYVTLIKYIYLLINPNIALINVSYFHPGRQWQRDQKMLLAKRIWHGQKRKYQGAITKVINY